MTVLDCRLQISAQGGCRGAGWSDGVLPQAEDSSSGYFLAPNRDQAAKSTSAPPGFVEKKKGGCLLCVGPVVYVCVRVVGAGKNAGRGPICKAAPLQAK